MNTAFASVKETLIKQSENIDSGDLESLSLDGGRIDMQALSSLKNIFYFLSLIFRYPSEEIYSEIENHLGVFQNFFLDYGGDALALPPLDDLQSEYIRLFVNNQGFVPAAPYASCYQGDGLLMNDNFHRLQQIMIESGFMLNQTVRDLEDHLAILLEFCATLVDDLAGKHKVSEHSPIKSLLSLMEVTYRYIEPMTDAFTGKIISHAQYGFYKVAGSALKALFLDADTIYDQLFGFRNHSMNEFQG